jgi:hypothetical protein
LSLPHVSSFHHSSSYCYCLSTQTWCIQYVSHSKPFRGGRRYQVN